jgi:L-amino acid N-acyltransferase YncA
MADDDYRQGLNRLSESHMRYMDEARSQGLAAQGSCRGIGARLNEAAVQQARVASDGQKAAAREENEACAVLAESHGFPELARHIRMRVSTPAKP